MTFIAILSGNFVWGMNESRSQKRKAQELGMSVEEREKKRVKIKEDRSNNRARTTAELRQLEAYLGEIFKGRGTYGMLDNKVTQLTLAFEMVQGNPQYLNADWLQKQRGLYNTQVLGFKDGQTRNRNEYNLRFNHAASELMNKIGKYFNVQSLPHSNKLQVLNTKIKDDFLSPKTTIISLLDDEDTEKELSLAIPVATKECEDSETEQETVREKKSRKKSNSQKKNKKNNGSEKYIKQLMTHVFNNEEIEARIPSDIEVLKKAAHVIKTLRREKIELVEQVHELTLQINKNNNDPMMYSS